jgi:hypothetical protein
MLWGALWTSGDVTMNDPSRDPAVDKLRTMIANTDELLAVVKTARPTYGATVNMVDMVLYALQEKNAAVLLGLRWLATREWMGSPCMILARTIQEAAVGMVYWEKKDLEKRTGNYWRFIIAALKGELDRRRERGEDLSEPKVAAFAAQVDAAYNRYRKKFETNKGERKHNPDAPLLYHGMVEWLREQGELDEFGESWLKQDYEQASGHVHLNPSSIFHHMGTDETFSATDLNLRYNALKTGLAAMYDIAKVVQRKAGNTAVVDLLEEMAARHFAIAEPSA